MSVPRRFNKLQDLARLDVLIEDDAVISRFFNITEFPEVLTQGKSSFLIGGSSLLKLGTEVKFEIVNDDSGAVIYTEPVANYLEGTARRVSIEIYDDNDLFGDCTLTVVGELNPALTNVPPEFQDSYNVRYTRKVYVSGAGVNTQPILFYKQPRIHVKEIVKPYITTTIPTGSITSTGTLKGSPILEDIGTTTNTQTEEQPAKFLKRKKKSLRSKLFGGGGNNSFIRKGRRRVRRSSPEADRYTMDRLTGVNFDSRMVDAKLRVISASVASSFDIQSYHQVPDLFITDIEDVKNSTTIVPDKPFTIIDTRFASDNPQREVIVPIESADFTVEFTPIPTQSLSTVNFRSYGDIRISRLRTFSGDIDRIKVYARNNDAFGDFEQISDQQIESPELLFNVFGAGNQSLGFFLEQDTIDTYWVKSSNSTATLTSETMLNAVSISGSNQGFNDNLTFNLNGTYEMTFNDETEYEVSFRAIGRKGPKNNINGNTGQKGRMGIFLSGSAFTINHELGDDLGFQLETTDGTPAFLEVDTGDQEDFDLVSEVFKPTFDGKGVIKFVIFSGNFELADISIKPASSTGFSPNFVQVIAPVPELTSERPDNYEFVAEFYDVNNNVAETIGFASASSFSGGNNYIAGGDNLLSGSVFVGSAIGGGIEMAGVSSGLIRSIGYDGFVSASEYPYSGSPGFMFFSGSVFPGSGDDYKGVGLELFGNTGSFFRYRSDPAILEIVTKQFFVGTSGSGNPEQYISGSNGNVEISSSDFHLTPEGNVTASSILLGSKSDGQFLQFVNNQLTVQGNLSVDQIRTPALINNVPSTNQNASSSIDQFGLATFKSASIAGFTINPVAIHSSDKSLVLSGSGQITGSTVLFTGGRIGGFSLTSNEITATDFVLNPSQKLLSLGSGDNIFIADADEGIQLGNATFASAPFSVTRQGVLKATSGTVAGWNLTSNTLEGGDLILSKDGSIRSRGYQSDVAGSGFILTAASGGFLEVENAKIRGTLATAVFEKESVNAVGGQLYVANSTVLTSSVLNPDGNHTAATATMSVVNASGFVAGEIISAKKVSDTGFQTEYMRVNSSSRASTDDTDLSGFLMVTRAYGSGTTGESGSLGDIPSAAQGYSGSQVIVSTGRVGTGYIRINANPSDQATPYIDIVERTGVGLYDVELKARLGDLSGVAGSRNVPAGFNGFGLMSEVAFLSGSNIKLEAPTFLLGDIHSAFVSGSNSFLEISSSRFHLKRDGSMQLGSAGSGITLDSSGNATFNGSITIQPSDLPPGTVSGSSQVAGVTGSLSASSAAAQAQTLRDSGSMANAIALTSTGMNILNSDGNTIAQYSADATIGRTSGTNSNVFIDSDGQIDIRRGTQVSASFGTTTTIGSTIGNHVKITSQAIEIKTNATTTALSASAAGLEMSGDINAAGGTIGGFSISSNTISSTTTQGFLQFEKAVNNDTTAILAGPTFVSNPNEGRFRAKYNGQITGSLVSFTGGKVGGWTLSDTTLTGGVVTLNSAGSIEVGSLTDATTTTTTNSGFFADSSGNILIKGNTNDNDYIKFSAAGGIDMKSSAFFLGDSTTTFVSGSTGKLHISSSNFEVAADGTVNISGNIQTAKTGQRVFLDASDNQLKFITTGAGTVLTIGTEIFGFSGSPDGLRLSNGARLNAFNITNSNNVDSNQGQPLIKGLHRIGQGGNGQLGTTERLAIWGEHSAEMFQTTVDDDSSTAKLSGVKGSMQIGGHEEQAGAKDWSPRSFGLYGQLRYTGDGNSEIILRNNTTHSALYAEVTQTDGQATQTSGKYYAGYFTGANVKVADGNSLVLSKIESDTGGIVIPDKVAIGTTSGRSVGGVTTPFANIFTLFIGSAAGDGDDGMLIVRDDATITSGNWLGGIGIDGGDGEVPSSVTEASAFIGAKAIETFGDDDKGAKMVMGVAPENQDDDTATPEILELTAAYGLIVNAGYLIKSRAFLSFGKDASISVSSGDTETKNMLTTDGVTRDTVLSYRMMRAGRITGCSLAVNVTAQSDMGGPVPTLELYVYIDTTLEATVTLDIDGTGRKEGAATFNSSLTDNDFTNVQQINCKLQMTAPTGTSFTSKDAVALVEVET